MRCTFAVTAVAVLVAALTLSAASCPPVHPDADPVLVRAEQSLEISFTTVDTLLLIEHQHRELLAQLVPHAEEYCDYARTVGPPSFRALDAAITAYREHRSPENKATLLTWLAVVEQLARDAQVVLAAWGGGQ